MLPEHLMVFGLLALGLYCARRMFDLLDAHSQRVSTQPRVPSQIVVPVQPHAEAAPPVPSDLSSDGDWNELQAMWAKEAVEQQQREDQRAEVINRALHEAQARKAAQLAAKGKLAVATAEPTAPDAPSAGSP